MVGVSLGGHGSFLGLFTSCFIFPITLLFPTDVAADALLEVSTVTTGQREKPALSLIMKPGDRFFYLENVPLQYLEQCTKKGGKKGLHVGAFPSLFFKLF